MSKKREDVMKRLLMFTVVLLVGVPLALADAPQTGVVTGTVIDPDGAAMSGVTVQLIGEQGTMTDISDDEGAFMFVFLVPGLYTARADMQGFQSAAGEIVVSAGGRADVRLQLGEVAAEEIVVTAESPLINKFDMSSGGTLEAKELSMFTGQQQQYRSRLLAMPDVIFSGDSQGTYPLIAGTRGARQVYFIDGVDVSFARWGGGSQLNLPATAVGEMKLESTGADAQFSRTIGAYTQTTVRSGTNDFHGSGFYQMQNLDWNAENKNVEVSRPDEIADGFDLSVGGPIVRDKLFFYLGYREVDNPGSRLMPSGEEVQSGTTMGSELIKLDWRPSTDQSVAAMYVLTPQEFPWWNTTRYDTPTIAAFDYPGDITTLRWNWAITDSLLLTANAASTSAEQNRWRFAESNIEAGCGPEDPCGNDWVYRPFDGDRLFRNGYVLPLGIGYTEFPRDQLNAALDIFTGVHEIKAGVDYQKLEWTVGGTTYPRCRGRGYDEYVPGGFTSNFGTNVARRGWCEFYPTKDTWADGWGPAVSGSDNLALFVRDKMALKRWTLNLGVRADQQVHENDMGETVLDTTDIAPRIAASYDLRGDSSLLLMGTAGRYYAQVQMSWAAAFNRGGTGAVAGSPRERWRFNPETGGYDTFLYFEPGSAEREIAPIDPYYKDEVTLGLEWQFHRDWAFKVRGLYFETKNYPQVVEQLDETGTGVYEVVENTPGTKNERQAISLSVQRRFRNNWMIAASYVYSNNEGNCPMNDNLQCNAVYGDLLDWTNDDGVPWTHYNRWGELSSSRPHNLKLRGAYNAQLGKGHSLNIGGLAYYWSGPNWIPWENVTHTPSGETRAIYMEPRGNRSINGRSQLDVSLQWSFPIAGQFNGFVRGEIVNITDEQVLTATSGMPENCNWPTDNIEGGACTGAPEPYAIVENYQSPRYIRLQIGFNF
jgi:hypothetical protein